MTAPQPEPGGTVLGADGCPGGWVVAEVGPSGVRWHDVPDVRGLLDLAAATGARVVAADVPIGLPSSGTRACDGAARRRLGGRAASSVFAAPVRRALDFATYAEARPHLPALSAQTFALVPRIRDTDRALREAGAHGLVVECHPEVTFRELTGQVLPRKKSAPGALQRLRPLERVYGPLPLDPPVGAALDDALDALACAWTAQRVARGAHEVLGGALDDTGVPMRIVV